MSDVDTNIDNIDDEIDTDLINSIAVQDDDSDEEEPKRRPGRPRGSKNKKKRVVPKEVIEKQKDTRTMSFDEWVSFIDREYGWQTPGVSCHLNRLNPLWHKGVSTGGLVAQKESDVFNMGEIVENYGGGDYEMEAHIPGVQGAKQRPPTIRRKRFRVAGHPKIGDPQVPQQSGDNGNPQVTTDATHPATQANLIKLVQQSHKQAYEAQNKGPDLSQLREPYEQAMAAARESYEHRVATEREAARQAQAFTEQRVNEAKLEAEAAKRERDRMEEETRQKVREATEGSTSILATLLPEFSRNASSQVNSVTQTLTAREASIEQRHTQELESLRRYHDSQVSQLQTLQAAEVTRMETTFQAQLGLLQQQLQHFQQQAQIHQAENLKLRDELMQLRVTQIEALKTQQDPITKMSELQQIVEVAKDVLPGVGGGSGDDLGEDAPAYMKMINNAINQLGAPIAAVLQAKAGGPPVDANGQMQLLSPAMAAGVPQHAMMPAQAMVQQPPPPQPPPEPKAPVTRLKKEDVTQAVFYIGNAFQAQTDAEKMAHSAMQVLPHDVMRLLSRKDPEKVLDEFEKAGLLKDSPLTTNDGRQYAIDVLKHLRENL